MVFQNLRTGEQAGVRRQHCKDSLFSENKLYWNSDMLAKKTTKNQITLPKAVVTQFRGIDYFDVSTDGDRIVLRPLRESRADEVRARLAELGITEQDVDDAIAWARQRS
jgi:hypothetical protein